MNFVITLESNNDSLDDVLQSTFIVSPEIIARLGAKEDQIDAKIMSYAEEMGEENMQPVFGVSDGKTLHVGFSSETFNEEQLDAYVEKWREYFIGIGNGVGFVSKAFNRDSVILDFNEPSSAHYDLLVELSSRPAMTMQ